MPNHTIQIKITPEGVIKSEIHGVAGPGCEGLGNWLADLGTVEEDRPTDDYFQYGGEAAYEITTE